jgi:hypothetical protein
MTNNEAKEHLARKLDIDYADIDNNDLFTDDDLQAFIQLGVTKAWDYKPWPFTQKTKTATTIDTEYYDHPDDLMNGSIYLLKVDGKEYKKLLIQDYLKYLEDYPEATDRFWSENETYIFINQNAYTVDDHFDLYGKALAPRLGDNDILPFSPTTDNKEYSGNEAIVLLAFSEALSSDKKKNAAQSEIERGKAYQILDLLWKPFEESRSTLQSKNRPMFEVPNFFPEPGNPPSSTGNFNYLP